MQCQRERQHIRQMEAELRSRNALVKALTHNGHATVPTSPSANPLNATFSLSRSPLSAAAVAVAANDMASPGSLASSTPGRRYTEPPLDPGLSAAPPERTLDRERTWTSGMASPKPKKAAAAAAAIAAEAAVRSPFKPSLFPQTLRQPLTSSFFGRAAKYVWMFACLFACSQFRCVAYEEYKYGSRSTGQRYPRPLCLSPMRWPSVASS